MVKDTRLVTSIIAIMRRHLPSFASAISDDDLRPIAGGLVNMIRHKEPKRALDQYVGSELILLSIEPNPYNDIVDDACALMSDSVGVASDR